MTKTSFEHVPIPADVVDLRTFRDWVHALGDSEKFAVSYLAGEIDIEMSPEEIHTHVRLKGDVFGDLRTFVKRNGLGDVLVDGAMFINEIADVATKPDIVLSLWETRHSGRVTYTESFTGSRRSIEIRGTPDLVVEIVSQSSVRKDTVRLRECYFLAGIREYWLIDGRSETIQFQILTRGSEGYVSVAPDADGYCRSPLLQRCFRVQCNTNPLGEPEYSLLDRA
jgi:Uma2 family endonuclease